MPKHKNYTLSEDALNSIEKVIATHRDARVVKRAMAIRLLHFGQTPEAVAEQLLVTMTTVYNWHERWETSGMGGLENRPKDGRPRKATAEYQQHLSQALESDPSRYGYSFTVWTLERLRDHLAQTTGIHLSTGRFADLMKQMDYVYRRPKTDLKAKQNQEAKAQVAALLEELKKAQHKTIASFSLWTKRP